MLVFQLQRTGRTCWRVPMKRELYERIRQFARRHHISLQTFFVRALWRRVRASGLTLHEGRAS